MIDRNHPYLRLIRSLRPYAGRFLAAVACMLVASACTVIPPWLIKNVVDDVLIARNMTMLNILPVAIVLLFLGKALASYGHQYLMNWVGQRIVMELRIRLYDHMQRMSLRYLYGTGVGELMSRVTNDVTVLQSLVTSVVVNLVVQGATFLGMLGFLVYINWRLTILTFAVLPACVFILDRAGEKLRKVGHEIQEQIALVSSIVQEAFSAIRIVRSFATEDLELERFRERNASNFHALLHGVQVQAALTGIIEVLLIIALALILWLGGRDVISGELTPGELVAFLGYLGFLVQPIRVFTGVLSSIQFGKASLERIFDVLDTPLDIESPEDAVVLPAIRGRVALEDVSFSYNANSAILKGVSLVAEPGEKIAIVGHTGAGKSTLVDLIPRFYDPDFGRVLVDGVDVRRMDLAMLRRQIGIVPQDPLLMKGSFRFNISYGVPDASDDRIRRAATIAGIDDFIEGLPKGYDTEIGERGVTLSGGERQRVAIARAIVRDPKILILDEATSSLDLEVEQRIQQAMRNAMEGRTSFIIAHRLSTVRDADRILVIRDGRIAEEGSHEDLLRLGGYYSHLCSIQSGHVVE